VVTHCTPFHSCTNTYCGWPQRSNGPQTYCTVTGAGGGSGAWTTTGTGGGGGNGGASQGYSGDNGGIGAGGGGGAEGKDYLGGGGPGGNGGQGYIIILSGLPIGPYITSSTSLSL